MNKLSPIVIFCYQRLRLLKALISSLSENPESKKSTLYFFSDNYQGKLDKKNVMKIRKYILNLKGFKKIILIKRKKKLGLTNNITTGVNYIFKKYKSAIFLEDDLVVSKNFLKFMNYSLNFYFTNKKVWHISGWNYNLINKNNKPGRKCEAYLWRVMNCWGWATWKDRWMFFRRNPKEIIEKWDNDKIKKFNLDESCDFFSQILRNHEKRINTWAIFWYATIFENKGLCLNPKISLTRNEGSDKLSTNDPHKVKNDLIFNYILNNKISLPKSIKENFHITNQIKSYMHKDQLENKYKYFKNIFKNYFKI